MPRHVHLVGSVPLADAETVFRTTAGLLGPRLQRIPDGETGRRRLWIMFQLQLLAECPLLHFDGPTPDFDRVVDHTAVNTYDFSRLALNEGADPAALKFGPLGYAEAALSSYAVFRRLKEEGAIEPQVRFQVSLPTPFASIAAFIAPRDMVAVFPAYMAALLEELSVIVFSIPHSQLSVQVDVAMEFGLFEGVFPPPAGDWRGFLAHQWAQMADAVPIGVELGFHLCYGDLQHRHFVEPKDAATLTDVANILHSVVKRSIEWIHLPVPRTRDDSAYFAPLQRLQLRPETEVFLGLLHFTDGVEGAQRRLKAAEAAVHRDFGLSTECGLGRRNDDTIPKVLQLYDVMSR